MRFFEMIRGMMRARKRPVHPLIIRNQQRFLRGIEGHGPLADYEFVALDTELTGFSRAQDEIVAIGAVRIKNQRILCGETFHALARPEARFQTKSTLVHRLTPQELRQAAGLAEVLPSFVEFCGNALLVGHFVRLDLEFLNRAARRLMGGVLATPYLDTLGLALRYREFCQGGGGECAANADYHLSALAAEYALPAFPAHNALQDALQTAYLFLFLAGKLQTHGVRTLDDFLKAGQRFNQPWWSM